MVAWTRPRLAFWLQRGDLATVEIAAVAGYELVVIDMEHGAVGPDALEFIIAHCRPSGLTCYVRVAAAERAAIQQALDFGADGVVVPQIEDAEHGARAAAFAKYPPVGSRGVGSGRTMRYGRADDAFFANENQRTVCHLMIETEGALRDVDAIASLDAVDGLFIGPADLSMARGRGAYAFSAGDAEDFRVVAAAARAAGKQLGLPAPSAEAYELSCVEGASYVTICDDLSALHAGFVQALR